NQKFVSIQHLVEFKENLRVMLISWLFIVLAARLQVEQVWELGNWRNLAFVAMLMLVVRPAAVFASSWSSDLTLQEKLFLCWLAPRGIVAAALASIFTLRLETLNLPVVPDGAAEQLVPITFLVIVSTVAIYGLTAAPVARWLGVAQPDPQGILIASCHPGARAIGHAFEDAGFRVLMVDSNPFNVQAARMEGLSTVYASILSEHAIEEINLGGIGRFLALTRNDEVNSLATLRFREIFGRAGVYQLAPNAEGRTRKETSQELIRGRRLFAADATYNELDARFSAGAVVKSTKLTKEFTFDDFQKLYGGEALLLFVVGESGALSINTVDQPMNPKPGDTVVCLVDQVERAEEEPVNESTEEAAEK
ncbi:MAG: cation:proton antiporter, partial [Pirellulales bacterium]